MTDDARMTGEDRIVAAIAARLVSMRAAHGLIDDCADLLPAPGQSFVLKTDPVRAGVHFFPDDDPSDIGWKALAANVSDLAAKAARPVAYLLAVSFNQAPTHQWLEGLLLGLEKAQDAFGISLVGGDTDRADGPVSLGVTVIGEVPAGRMVPRAGARPGDVIFVSGTLGAAAVGLDLRRRHGLAATEVARADGAALETALARYLRPQPRLGLKAALRRYARASMDVSDGLAKDLGRMASASGCRAVIDVEAVPIDPAVRLATSDFDTQMRYALAHGDDYEVIASVDPADATPFAALAAAGGVPVSAIGRWAEGAGVTWQSGGGRAVHLTRLGFDHFG